MENCATARLIDLSHTIEDGMVTYKGLPAPLICDHLSREQSRAVYAEGTEFQIGRITMVANTGTYIDTPFHRYEHGHDLAGLPLSRASDLPGVVVRLEGFEGVTLPGGVCATRGGRLWAHPAGPITSAASAGTRDIVDRTDCGLCLRIGVMRSSCHVAAWFP
jgi:hypothetical protein